MFVTISFLGEVFFLQIMDEILIVIFKFNFNYNI